VQKQGLTLKVASFLEMVYSWNYGISFGMFKNYYQYSNAVFIVLNSLITAYLWYIMLKCKSALTFLGYSCIIGGAISNVIDRLFRGAVFDFIYFHYGDYSFPIFNLADSFISIGVAVLIYDYYKVKKSIEEKAKKNYDEFEIEAERIRKLDDVMNNLSIK
jgi:signal peptidase II